MTQSNAIHRLVRRVPTRIAGAGALTLALAAGFAGGRVTLTASGPSGSAGPAPVARAVEPAAPPAFSASSYSAIVERVAPAVVTIRVEKRAEVSRTSVPEDLREFFGPFGQQFRIDPRNAPRERESGLGSGVIVRADGYILTNNHVVEGADKIRVDLTDGRSFPATVVGTDPASDLAVVRVQGQGLPTLPYGNSDSVKVGDVVLAVGNPMGIGQTVTMGIVSAKGRSHLGEVGDGSYEDFLQTDAPINRGNSGGALVDMQGQLVGINAQILSPSGGNIGLGFAIPSTMAHAVAEQLIAGGVVHRSKLGVNIQGVTPELAESLGLADVRGALVSGVEPGSPAEHAGLRQGDVITSFDGRPVSDANALRNQVASTRPGNSAAIKVLRDGRTETVTARLIEREPAKATARNGRGGSAGEGEESFGMTIAPLTPQIARQLDVPVAGNGIVVTDVDPDGVAASAGIRPGDVIKRINGREISTVDGLRSALNAKTGKPALVLVAREGGEVFVALPQRG